jgi:hypothetical protein
MSLKDQAVAMMSGIPNSTNFVGLSFEYQPVNPGTGDHRVVCHSFICGTAKRVAEPEWLVRKSLFVGPRSM